MTGRYLVLALGVVSVSFAAIFIRLADAPPLVIAAYRLCIASLLIDPVAWFRSRQELLRLTRRDVILSVLSGTFLALHFGLWIASLSYTTVATSVVLVTTTPPTTSQWPLRYLVLEWTTRSTPYSIGLKK